MVPYIEDGKPKIMFIVVGEGTEFGVAKIGPDGRRDPYDLVHINHFDFDPKSPDFFENFLGREHFMSNPERLAAQAIRCKPTILMKHSKTRAVFGLDLMAGTAFLGSSGLETMNRLAGKQDTVKKLTSFNDRPNLTNMLEFVEEIYDLDESFTDDVMFLAGNRDQYLSDVLLPPAATLAKCQPAFGEAIELVKVREDLVRPFGTVRSLSMISNNQSFETLKKAADAVRGSRPDDPRAL